LWFVGSEKPCIYSVPNRKQSYENEYENIVELDPLYKAMERIKEDDRQLIQMHFIQEYSYREISRIKKRSVGAVIKRVNRSLEFMKSAM